MVWTDLKRSLLTLAALALWVWRVDANIPLYSADTPDDKRGETIELLERALLAQLGLREKPRRPERPVRVPQHMIDLYNQQTNDPDYLTDLYFNKASAQHANTARSFKNIGLKTHRDDTNVVNLYFNASTIPDHESVVTAELQLTPNSTAAASHAYKIELYEILSRPHSVEGAVTRLIDTRVRRARSGDAPITLDITPAVHGWHTSKHRTHGVQVHVRRLDGQRTPHGRVRLRRDVAQTDEEWSDTKPVVIVYTHDRTLSRVKRGSRRRNRGSKRVRSECQRHEMKVDFKDVGWEDWILAPRDYEAYYCHGVCPFPLSDHLNATNHAIIQTLVSEIEPEAVPPACCVPTDLSPISMLYLNGDDVILKNYPDMVVESCGCR